MSATIAVSPAAARVRHKHIRHHPKAGKIQPVEGQFVSDGKLIGEFHCAANSRGKSPVVMLLHGCAPEGFGANEFKQMCVELADRGYYAMFIEYYGLHGAPNCLELAMTSTTSLAPDVPIPDDVWIETLKSARDSLTTNPRADTSRLGVIGFSFGGTLAVIAAALEPNLINGIVDYYGFSNDRVEDAVAQRSTFPPTLILQGDADRRVRVVDSIHLHNAIARHRGASEIHVFPGVEHGFNFPEAPGYDADATRDAWSLTISFLDRHLK